MSTISSTGGFRDIFGEASCFEAGRAKGRGLGGGIVSSPSGVWGRAPAEIEFDAFVDLKSDIRWQPFR